MTLRQSGTKSGTNKNKIYLIDIKQTITYQERVP